MRARRVPDLLTVGAVTLVTGLDVWWNPPGTPEPDPLGYALLVVSCGALVIRSTWPLVTLLICAGAFTAWSVAGYRGELLLLPTAVALYSVAVRRRSLVVGTVVVLWSAVLQWIVDGRSSAPMTAIPWPVVAVLLGEVVRGRRELQREQAAREAHLVAEREQRIAQERLRIAWEVHDVVAHVMAGVTVQMGVAVAAIDRRPEVARAALRQARAASRDALTELRTAVALLRGSDAPPGPPPDLAGLRDLVDGVRSPTLKTQLLADATQLPAVLELTVYRIVQEALTNVVRHAAAANVVVTLRREPDSLVVDVVDDGRGCTGDPGLGLRGMAERAASVGGHLETGPAPEGGFRVHAVLPVDTSAPPVEASSTQGGAR